jgi:RIO kinase 2
VLERGYIVFEKEEPEIRSVRIFKTLDSADIRVLSSIELGMRRFELVPFEEVLKIAKMPKNDLEFRLSNLLKKKLAETWAAPYKGFMLAEMGYDSLAFYALVKQNVIEAMGPPIGVGKECTCIDLSDRP